VANFATSLNCQKQEHHQYDIQLAMER